MKTFVMILILSLGTLACQTRAADPVVRINADFPGGNIEIEQNAGDLIQLKPRLDGGRNWFYWYFEATALKPGDVTFVFPEKVAGFENGAVGFQGPAISLDDGQSWRWMGHATAVIRGRSFSYDFTQAGQKVRFAVTIPYLQADFDEFVKRHAGNPHFKTSVLAKSLGGRDVELVQIGAPGPGVKPILITARHHACETIASFVLEGILATAMSDTAAGKEFRGKYVLYAVPFVDKDGVESGDQGKGRKPHDHNRDYGEHSIFPEVQAIMMLGAAKQIAVAFDLHCPTLVMEDHQVMYFIGPTKEPPGNHETVTKFAGLIKQRLPAASPTGPLVWLKDMTAERRTMFAGHFALQPGCLMSVTLEIPFAPPERKMDPDSVRSYGAAVGRALNDLPLPGAAMN